MYTLYKIVHTFLLPLRSNNYFSAPVPFLHQPFVHTSSYFSSFAPSSVYCGTTCHMILYSLTPHIHSTLSSVSLSLGCIPSTSILLLYVTIAFGKNAYRYFYVESIKSCFKFTHRRASGHARRDKAEIFMNSVM